MIGEEPSLDTPDITWRVYPFRHSCTDADHGIQLRSHKVNIHTVKSGYKDFGYDDNLVAVVWFTKLINLCANYRESLYSDNLVAVIWFIKLINLYAHYRESLYSDIVIIFLTGIDKR